MASEEEGKLEVEFGFRNRDEKEQQHAKNRYEFRRKTTKLQDYFLRFLGIALALCVIGLGIKAVFDRSYVKAFGQMLALFIVLCAVYFGTGPLLIGLFTWVFRRQNNEKLPPVSQRNLRKTLNYMNGNVGGLVWNILWGIIAGTALLVSVMEGAFTLENVVNFGRKLLLIFAVGYVFFAVIHNRRDLTKRMLGNTVDYYNYGDGKLFAEYVDWSLRENMLLRCKQYALTKEFFLGYAHTDIGFVPVVLPRDFIKQAEVREAVYSSYRVTVDRTILACKLNNGKVIDFYLSRLMGSRMALELLKKHGFKFTVRTDVVEYQ